ncbi:MAG: outer membrane beta-barrel protein [Woeseiaceae bacterium]
MLRSVLMVILVAFSATVGAQGTNFNYVQGSYGRVDLDDSALDVDGDGLGVSASLEIDENFHVFGEYQTADIDFGVDLTIMELGVGYHTNISPHMDVYANLGYVDIEADAGIGSADDSGFSIGIGLRGSVSEAVELYGGLDYIDFDDSDSETRANAGFILSLTETLGVGLRAILWDDVNVFQVNARLYFD